jgi:hypothetical protein
MAANNEPVKHKKLLPLFTGLLVKDHLLGNPRLIHELLGRGLLGNSASLTASVFVVIVTIGAIREGSKEGSRPYVR